MRLVDKLSTVVCVAFRWSTVKVSGWLCGHHKIHGILAICQWKQTTCFSSTDFRDCFRCFFHHDILCKLYIVVYGKLQVYTFPRPNSSHRKIRAWKMNFRFGSLAKLLVPGLKSTGLSR